MRACDALGLLHDAVHSEDCKLEHRGKYLDHVNSVARTAYRVAWDLYKKGHPVDPDFANVIGIVHDLGRARPEAYLHGEDVHEYCTRQVLMKAGFPRESAVASRHFIAFEKARDILVPKGWKEFGGSPLDPETYKQTGIPEIVLTYADSVINSDGSIADWREKLRTLPEKYRGHKLGEMLEGGGLERVWKLCAQVDCWLGNSGF
jgi:hypothetical protein